MRTRPNLCVTPGCGWPVEDDAPVGTRHCAWHVPAAGNGQTATQRCDCLSCTTNRAIVRMQRIAAESDFWADETETPRSWEDTPEGPRCIHVGLLPHPGADLDQEWLCGHCGQMVPEHEL